MQNNQKISITNQSIGKTMNSTLYEFAIACLEHRTEIYLFLFSSSLIAALLLGGNNE